MEKGKWIMSKQKWSNEINRELNYSSTDYYRILGIEIVYQKLFQHNGLKKLLRCT